MLMQRRELVVTGLARLFTDVDTDFAEDISTYREMITMIDGNGECNLAVQANTLIIISKIAHVT